PRGARGLLLPLFVRAGGPAPPRGPPAGPHARRPPRLPVRALRPPHGARAPHVRAPPQSGAGARAQPLRFPPLRVRELPRLPGPRLPLAPPRASWRALPRRLAPRSQVSRASPTRGAARLRPVRAPRRCPAPRWPLGLAP